MKIRTKFFLAFFLTSFVLTVGAVLSSYYIFSKNFTEAVGDNLVSTVESRANHIETYLDIRKTRVVDFSSDGFIKKSLEKINNFQDREKTEAELSEHLILNKIVVDDLIYEVFVLDTKGRVVATTNSHEEIGRDFSNYTLFNKAIENSVYLSGIEWDQEFDRMGMVISGKVQKNGNFLVENSDFLGVVVTRVSPKGLFDILLERAGLGETGNIYLANRQGYITSPSRFLEDVTLEYKINNSVLEHCFAEGNIHKHGVLKKYFDYRNIKVFGSHEYLPTIDSCLLVEIDQQEAFAAISGLLKIYIISILVIILVILFLSYWLSFYISNPIIKLKEGAHIIGKGNLDHKTIINSKDEIGELSREFDKMRIATKSALVDLGKKAQNLEKFKLAVENASDQIIITDPEGIVLYGNKAIEKITGYNVKNVINKKAGVLWDGQMSKKYYKDMWDTILVKKKPFFGEMKNKRKNGEKYYSAISISPVLDDEGEIVYLVWIERDITKEKELDRAKSDFISVASHQLRTPLTGIQWVVERFMKKEKLSKEGREYLQDIHSSSRRLGRLVDLLLNVSRIESGHVSISPQPLELIGLIRSHLQESHPLWKKKNLTVTFKKHPRQLSMMTDSSALQNIIQSVVSNAIEYTPKGGKINLSVEKKGKQVFFVVSDTGIGIPKADQSKLFKKFFRGSNAQEVKTDGTGLGLYITKQAIELLGGSIRFESKEGKGTTFYMEMPINSSVVVGAKKFV